MNKRCAVASLVLGLLLIPNTAFASSLADECKAAADAMVNRFVDAWNRADGVAYGENYWPEAELVDPIGRIYDGRDAIAQMHVELWAGIFKDTRVKGSVRRIHILTPKYMIVDFDLELSDHPGGNHLKHILEKRNGTWKILSAQNTSFH